MSTSQAFIFSRAFIRSFLIAGTLLVASTTSVSAFPNFRSVLPGPVMEPAASQDSANILQSLLTAKRVEVGKLSIPTAELEAFYASRSYAPVWADDGELTKRAEKMLAVVRRADRHALPVGSYGLGTIAALLEETEMEEARQTALLDLLVSHAVLHYAEDIHLGRAAPAYSLTGKRRGAAMLTAIAETGEPEEFLETLPPRDPQYAALKRLYHELKTDPAAPWPIIPVGPSIKPGTRDARVLALRRTLAAKGDLVDPAPSGDPVYDPVTQDAVAKFQRRHGLNGDGTVGKETLAALNTPLRARLPQIAATMERLRWQPETLPDRYVLVNLPEFTLRAFDEGREALSMRVIVGAKKNPTPLFANIINQVVFNPTWSVPKKIAVREMLGKIRENPDYLPQHNYRVLRYTGGRPEEVDPWDIDWDSLGEGHFPYLLRQDAGDDNALGKVKFNIPDSGAIYLHDTANPKLFAKDFRALSHGCIRLEKPRAMAHYILGESELTPEKIDGYYDSDTPRTLKVEPPVTLYLVYWTAQISADGTRYFYPDIYGLDAELTKKLGV